MVYAKHLPHLRAQYKMEVGISLFNTNLNFKTGIAEHEPSPGTCKHLLNVQLLGGKPYICNQPWVYGSLSTNVVTMEPV